MNRGDVVIAQNPDADFRPADNWLWETENTQMALPRIGDKIVITDHETIPQRWRNTEGTIVAINLHLTDWSASRVTIADILGSQIELPLHHVRPRPSIRT